MMIIKITGAPILGTWVLLILLNHTLCVCPSSYLPRCRSLMMSLRISWPIHSSDLLWLTCSVILLALNLLINPTLVLIVLTLIRLDVIRNLLSWLIIWILRSRVHVSLSLICLILWTSKLLKMHRICFDISICTLKFI